MKPKKQHSKPTGSNTKYAVFTNAPAVRMDLPKLPASKSEAERLVMQAVLRRSIELGLSMYGEEEPVQNAENELDFTVNTPSGKEDVELVEFAPLAEFGGSYDRVPRAMIAGDLASLVSRVIAAKASKYGPGVGRARHLLIYTTHELLPLSDAVRALVSLQCTRVTHGFKSIAYCHFVYTEFADLRMLFPKDITAETCHRIAHMTFSESQVMQFVESHPALEVATNPVHGRSLLGHAPSPEDVWRAPPVTVGATEPCPCGSGRKFRKCHGRL